MKLVILDRDGVINHDSPDYIKSAQEWHPIEGSLDAIALLHRHGFTICVASNQSGLARGLFSRDALEEIHAKMRLAVEEAGGRIGQIVFCPHHPDEGCSCRKPATGMLEEIARAERVSLDGVPFVGDSLSDLDAAERAGCQPVLVLTGKGERTAARLDARQVPVFADLAAAARAIVDGTLASTN